MEGYAVAFKKIHTKVGTVTTGVAKTRENGKGM